MFRISHLASVTLASLTPTFTATTVFAAQGPGIMAGTASPFLQTAMAIVVYGLSAAIVAAGLIGGLRRR